VISQIIPNIGYHWTDCLHCFVEFGGGSADFSHPMPHFSRRVDIDTFWVGGTPQATIFALDGHRSEVVAATRRIGTTTSETTQANM
jgi:hypothetical protein